MSTIAHDVQMKSHAFIDAGFQAIFVISLNFFSSLNKITLDNIRTMRLSLSEIKFLSDAVY